MPLELLPAKPLVKPTWSACPPYEFTYGPEVCDVAALAGFAPDPEQALILDGMFGVAENGKAAAFEVDIFGPRQNIKTGTIVQAALGWLYVLELPNIIYTAQNLDAAEECWALMASLIEGTPALSRRLKSTRGERPGITEGKGSWAINLVGDLTMLFRTRGPHTGRSLKGDRVVLDEGYAVTRTHIGGMLPVLSALPDPQYVLASSAGKIESEVAIDARDRGRGGGTYRQHYTEYGDPDAGKGCQLGDRCDHAKPPNGPPGCALDDEERWARIMPALGGRVQVDTVRGLRLSMPPTEFARECMVWWDVDGGDGIPPAIDFTIWRRRERRDAPRPERAAIFVDVAPLGDWSTIAAAGTGSDGRTLVITLTAPGTGWLVAKLKELRERDDVAAMALWPQSKAGGLIPTLVKNEIEHETVSTTWMGQACTLLQEKVKNDELEHVGQNDLDSGVKNATTRWSGEAELWNRRDPTVNISPVVAASGAVALWERLVDEDYDIEDSYLSDDDSDEDVE